MLSALGLKAWRIRFNLNAIGLNRTHGGQGPVFSRVRPWTHGFMEICAHRLKALTPMGPKGPGGRGPMRWKAHGSMGACAPIHVDPRAYRPRDPFAHELCTRAQISTNEWIHGPSIFLPMLLWAHEPIGPRFHGPKSPRAQGPNGFTGPCTSGPRAP